MIFSCVINDLVGCLLERIVSIRLEIIAFTEHVSKVANSFTFKHLSFR